MANGLLLLAGSLATEIFLLFQVRAVKYAKSVFIVATMRSPAGHGTPDTSILIAAGKGRYQDTKYPYRERPPNAYLEIIFFNMIIIW